MNDYSEHLTQLESLVKQIRELAPAKDPSVMFLAERAISRLWEIRDIAELGYPLPELPAKPADLPRATFPGQF